MGLKVKMQANKVEEDINARLQELGLSICFDPSEEDNEENTNSKKNEKNNKKNKNEEE